MTANSPLSPNDELSSLLSRFGQRDRRALARLLTRLDDGRDVDRILGEVAVEKPALKVGITGAAGAGKSTLVASLLDYLRRSGKTVAVLCCDPASPFTGGALLGDRVRMDYDPADPGVFVRSFSSRGATGGLSTSAQGMARLLEGFGFEVVLIETVGAGQDQLAARDVVDVLLLLVTPIAGDDIQYEKAGLLEAADVVAVNKSDLPGADAALASLRAMLGLLPSARSIPIVPIVAKKNQGIETLWSAIESCSQAGATHRRLAAGRRLLAALLRRLETRFAFRAHHDPEVLSLIDRFDSGAISEPDASAALLSLLRNDDEEAELDVV